MAGEKRHTLAEISMNKERDEAPAKRQRLGQPQCGRFARTNKRKMQKLRCIQVSVKLPSGSTLASFEVDQSYTGADVKKVVKEHLPAGAALQALVHGLEPLEDTDPVSNLESGAAIVLQAVLGAAEPVLHLKSPCSAPALSRRHWNWGSSGDGCSDCEDSDGDPWDFCECLEHSGMDSAPAAAGEVAKQMHRVLGKKLLTLTHLETELTEEYGEWQERDLKNDVVVISNPGSNTKTAVLRALGISSGKSLFERDEAGDANGEGEVGVSEEAGEGGEEAEEARGGIWGHALVQDRNWCRDVIGENFCRDPDYDSAESLPPGWSSKVSRSTGETYYVWPERGISTFEKPCHVYSKKVVALSDLMATHLVGHFEFSFDERWEGVAPVLYGGFASDGSIVGILSSQGEPSF